MKSFKFYYKIIWIVHKFWLVNKCVFVVLWKWRNWNFRNFHENDVICLQVMRIYNFVEEIKLYIHTSFIIFPLVLSENNNFIKEIKHVLRAFIAWRKVRILELVKTLDCFSGFHQAMKERKKSFTSWIKLMRNWNLYVLFCSRHCDV